MAFSDPRKIIRGLSLHEGMKVADFGSGSGHYSLEAARAVGENGHVCAVDIQKGLLERLKKDAVREELYNVDVVWGDIDEEKGSRLSSASFDAVIMANVLFQIERRKKVVEEVARVLKPKGVALVVDWEDSFRGIGPQTQDIITKETARKLFEDAGFTLKRGVPDAGEHHFGLVFKKMA